LGVSTLKRLPQLPNVPTIDEAGLKGYEVTIWNGFFAPKGTPKDILTRLNQALVTALSDEKIRVRLTELAVDLPDAKEATPDALREQLKASIDKWVPAIKAAGVQPQ
jgi:tripartite-type tricarboxylate transporter receptor subunit TctC